MNTNKLKGIIGLGIVSVVVLVIVAELLQYSHSFTADSYMAYVILCETETLCLVGGLMFSEVFFLLPMQFTGQAGAMWKLHWTGGRVHGSLNAWLAVLQKVAAGVTILVLITMLELRMYPQTASDFFEYVAMCGIISALVAGVFFLLPMQFAKPIGRAREWLAMRRIRMEVAARIREEHAREQNAVCAKCLIGGKEC